MKILYLQKIGWNMINRVRHYVYADVVDLLGRIPTELDVVYDLGAGKRDNPISLQVREIMCNYLISVEAFEPYIDFLLKSGNKAKSHDVVLAHLTNSNYKVKVCDLVIMLDVIEHLPKDEALELITYLKTKAKTILIFTPEGDTIGYSNGDMGNELQSHLSGWTAEEFELLGFDVVVYEQFHTHVKDYPIGAMWATWTS